LGRFGEKLRAQREQRGITLESISSTTKINTRMLRALETENFEQLPGGVFNKGFIRAYARHVGLDEDEAIADYLAALHEDRAQSQNLVPDLRTPTGRPHSAAVSEFPHTDKQTDKPISSDAAGSDANHAKSDGVDGVDKINTAHSSASHFSAATFGEAGPEPATVARTIIAAVAIVLVLALLAFWNVHRRKHQAASSVVSEQTPARSANSSPSSLPSGGLPSGGASQKISSTNITPAGKAKSVTTERKPSTEQPAATTGPQGAASQPNASNVRMPAPAAKASTVTLLVRAEKTSWVSIAADGKPVAEETLIAPAEISAHGSNEIVVKAGNASGVSFVFNGKDIPAQGDDGEVRTYTFDNSGMKVAHVTSGDDVPH
jgi:cytoskeletal protein RodZ